MKPPRRYFAYNTDDPAWHQLGLEDFGRYVLLGLWIAKHGTLGGSIQLEPPATELCERLELAGWDELVATLHRLPVNVRPLKDCRVLVALRAAYGRVEEE